MRVGDNLLVITLHEVHAHSQSERFHVVRIRGDGLIQQGASGGKVVIGKLEMRQADERRHEAIVDLDRMLQCKTLLVEFSEPIVRDGQVVIAGGISGIDGERFLEVGSSFLPVLVPHFLVAARQFRGSLFGNVQVENVHTARRPRGGIRQWFCSNHNELGFKHPAALDVNVVALGSLDALTGNYDAVISREQTVEFCGSGRIRQGDLIGSGAHEPLQQFDARARSRGAIV